VHALILFLFLGPVLATSSFRGEDVPGGGGAGPAGGGGGGSGGAAQSVEFVRVRPDPTTLPVVAPIIPPVKPVPIAVVPPLVTEIREPTSTVPVQSGVSTGATGNAGTAGSGPGSGGGVGSGIGPGKGSGVGPGTGGGPAKDFPPTPREVFLPPLPQPASVRGQHLRAWFDVDEKGNSKLISFEKSRDGGYNRLLEQTLKATRFRPGVGGDGVPKRDTAMIEIIF
jgi:protein TonB